MTEPTEEEVHTAAVQASEIAWNMARARKANAEAEMAEHTAEGHYIQLKAARYEEYTTSLSDDRLRVLRFGNMVNTATVDQAIRRLTRWHREDEGEAGAYEIIFTSPGGNIIDGLRFYDFIQEIRHAGHHVTTGTYGMAASMAGVLLQAGDVRYSSGNAWLMIHRASFGAQGSMDDMEDQVALVKRMEDRLLDILEDRSSFTRKRIKANWNRKDWWLTPEEALTGGFIDEIRGVIR